MSCSSRAGDLLAIAMKCAIIAFMADPIKTFLRSEVSLFDGDLPFVSLITGSPVLGGIEPYHSFFAANFREKFKKFVSIREIRGEEVWLSR